jgi:hypothetical protein
VIPVRWWCGVSVGFMAAGLGAAEIVAFQQDDFAFDHPLHENLFLECETCHAGAAAPGSPMWPTSESCATCHDGDVEALVDWRPPTDPPPSNLRFDHVDHVTEVREQGDSTACSDCHADPGAAWMSVRPPTAPQCLACHEIVAEHYAAPDSACAQCHVPLVEAVRLTRGDVAEFPTPPSHESDGFGGEGHGELAEPDGATPEAIAASCATCHAREFCIQCHVDAPEQTIIQGLRPDERSLTHEATLAAPADHDDPGFSSFHAAAARSAPLDCSTCHTRESCVQCHVSTPYVADSLYPAGVGRSVGAEVARTPPPTHDFGFRDLHGPDAASTPATCAGCHARESCLDCHRPSAGASTSGYHPSDYLSRHPTAAYTRETSCSDCHNDRGFCASCHQQAGLVGVGRLDSRYHDAKQSFVLGHGQAARQNLESCVSCHAERDCTSCHSATRGRRYNPHGPGFDAERLRSKNPEMCLACHRS